MVCIHASPTTALRRCPTPLIVVFELFLPVVELMGYLGWIRRAIAGERRNGSFGAEHVESTLIQCRVGRLELGER